MSGIGRALGALLQAGGAGFTSYAQWREMEEEKKLAAGETKYRHEQDAVGNRQRDTQIGLTRDEMNQRGAIAAVEAADRARTEGRLDRTARNQQYGEAGIYGMPDTISPDMLSIFQQAAEDASGRATNDRPIAGISGIPGAIYKRPVHSDFGYQSAVVRANATTGNASSGNFARVQANAIRLSKQEADNYRMGLPQIVPGADPQAEAERTAEATRRANAAYIRALHDGGYEVDGRELPPQNGRTPGVSPSPSPPGTGSNIPPQTMQQPPAEDDDADMRGIINFYRNQ